ncbi:LuxR C-terminal-related transcriptional regulator [Mycobacterium sp. 155]|uniref:response regulator transcription factor n=1 Tax=Mycobacterium sp. 155 TaxID=1157943 RepID=UPI00037882E6|nr:LuxR C-terminal-related transcriptional regulator [Mycobacterium sp. 155]
MVAISETVAPAPVRSRSLPRNIGVTPTASMITGAAVALVWFWIPLSIIVIGISSIPSLIGFALSAVLFVYLMRGVEWVERTRSEAVFGLVEERYAADLIASDTKGFGYLLKDRVADVPAFLDAVAVVDSGGTVLDPEVVAQILVRSHRRSALDQLTPRQRDVLQLMAEGRTNSAIATALHISVGSAEKHIASIFTKLALAPDESENRRVLAVLRYLES